MKMKQIEGKVILKLLIDENGNLLKYEVLESTDNEFLNSVLNELKNVDFIPAYSDGFPIKVYGILKVHFKLD
jgi:TonB family protein